MCVGGSFSSPPTHPTWCMDLWLNDLVFAEYCVIESLIMKLYISAKSLLFSPLPNLYVVSDVSY